MRKCSLYHSTVLGGTNPRFFVQFRCKRFPDNSQAMQFTSRWHMASWFLCVFLFFSLLWGASSAFSMPSQISPLQDIAGRFYLYDFIALRGPMRSFFRPLPGFPENLCGRHGAQTDGMRLPFSGFPCSFSNFSCVMVCSFV